MPSLFIEPCLPTISRSVPTGPGWAYEIKHDEENNFSDCIVCRIASDPSNCAKPQRCDLQCDIDRSDMVLCPPAPISPMAVIYDNTNAFAALALEQAAGNTRSSGLRVRRAVGQRVRAVSFVMK